MKGIIGALLGAIVGVCAGVVIANLQGWAYSDYYSRNLMTRGGGGCKSVDKHDKPCRNRRHSRRRRWKVAAATARKIA